VSLGLSIRLLDEDIGHPGLDRAARRRSAGTLELVVDNLTAAEVIAARVSDEWARLMDDAGRTQDANRATLVERILRFDGTPPASLPDAIAAAQRAFRDGQILFFWNDAQIVEPHAFLNLRSSNEALFLRLYPMTGG
jgi:hypothetical protein